MDYRLKKRIESALAELGLASSQSIIDRSARYLSAIIKANESLKLTGTSSEELLVNKHYMDSLYLLKFLRLACGNMLDLGSGAGLPGVPIKIMHPESPLFLLDASRKKLNFLKYTLGELGLQGVHFLYGRAEEWGHDGEYREFFKYVFCRGVAEIPVLLEIGLPFLSPGGFFFIYKGPGGEGELLYSQKVMAACGGEIEKKYHYRLKSGEKRSIYVIRKVAKTPTEYPRKPGIPFKKPFKD